MPEGGQRTTISTSSKITVGMLIVILGASGANAAMVAATSTSVARTEERLTGQGAAIADLRTEVKGLGSSVQTDLALVRSELASVRERLVRLETVLKR